ncbi:hypothetical protein [Mycobacterium sp.]|uniref:hypothetical protein n=1 Tax=Mycobacterium sp. TaxID=1785 RepID=UPI002D79648A|nr:hypothetical protein [Mycobacterium sp.]
MSHAWTEGPMMYIVYKAPPSEVTCGLVRDTRESLIDPSPWLDLEEAVRYYYLLDLEENWPGRFTSPPEEPGTILWRGDPCEGLPVRLSDIPDEHRYTPPPEMPSVKRDRDQVQRVVNEPRRYADPP